MKTKLLIYEDAVKTDNWADLTEVQRLEIARQKLRRTQGDIENVEYDRVNKIYSFEYSG